MFINSTTADMLRLAAEVDKVNISQALEDLLRRRSDFKELLELAQKMGTVVGKMAQIADEAEKLASVPAQKVSRSVGQVGQPEVPKITRDPVSASTRIFTDLMRHQGRALELEAVDLEALDEVYTLACSVTADVAGGELLFSKWAHRFIEETPDPLPRFLLLKVHRYAITK